MTIYLSMDGVDDNLVAPSMSYNEVIIDFSATYRADDYIFDNPFSDSSLMTYWTSTTNKMQTVNYSSYYINGMQKTTEDMGILSDQRNTVRIISPSTMTGLGYIFSTRRSSHPTKGKIYSVKFLNGGVLQAHYDMTTGTVQDQSGNGRHATLNGGTWLDDGTGGTGTTLTVNLSDTLTVSEYIKERFIGRLQVDSISFQDSDNDKVNLKFLDNITFSDSVTSNKGKSIVLTDSLNISDSIFKAINILKNEAISLTDGTAKQTNLRIYDVLVTADTLNTYLPNGPQLIKTIVLDGKQELNIYLVGRQETTVVLDGKQGVNIELKGGL